jgi:release factor glutamine methyltransferase
VITIAHTFRSLLSLGLDRLDAQLLILHALGRPAHDRAWLLAHDTDALPETALATLQAAALRRAAGEPLAYITGHKEFYGLDLAVDARVLVPRPDTETLVDWALELLAPEPQSTRVLDLGTGSGAIALALKHTRLDLDISAVDFSADALVVAHANAQRLSLDVAFAQGSWLSAAQGRFSLIVSNPPYIAAADPHLDALKHEPLRALASGADGLDDIRSIIQQSPEHLLPGGWLLLEHGYDQAAAVRALLQGAGLLDAQSRRDLAGIERCSGARMGQNDQTGNI